MVDYINRMNQIYGNDTQVARAPRSSPGHIPFMAPELQEDINPIPNTPDLLREEGIQVGQQVKDGGRIYDTKKYLQGGRVGLKPGGIVEPGVMYYAKKTSGIGTGVKAIDDPNVIKQAENILKKLVEKKHGHKVLDWSEKATHPKLKNLPVKARGNLNDLIIKIADKNGWLDGTQYKNTMVVETFMDDYARNGYFTGNEKTSDLLKEFQSTHPDRKFQDINKVFKKWKNGDIVVKGYDINNLERGTLEALDDWSPTMASERSINKTNQLKYLDGLNNQKLNLNQAQAKFRRKFPDAAKNAFWHRVDQLYQLKVEGKIPSGKNTFKTHDIVKGDRSDWLKKGLTHNKAGNYNKLLLAADELDALGKTKQATRLRNSAIKYFSPNKGILAKVPGQAEHPWFRTHGGTSGQLKIDSLVRGDLNTFKNLNFEAPIQKLINEYGTASTARKAEIQNLIKNRQLFMDELTGGMTKNVKFNFTPNEVKVTNLTKPIDTLKMRELGLLKERGAAFEKSILSKGKDLDLITKEGQLVKRQVSDKQISKILKNSGLSCALANGINCNDPRAYIRSINELKAKAAVGDKAAMSTFRKVANAVGGKFKGPAAFTVWGILGEIGFALPFAAMDYADGKSTAVIINNASFGLFGMNEEEEAISLLPEGSLGGATPSLLRAGERIDRLTQTPVLEGPRNEYLGYKERIFPQSRMGMDQAKFKKRQAKVIPDAKLDFTDKLAPFLEGPRNEYYNQEKAVKAFGDFEIAKAKQKAMQEQKAKERAIEPFQGIEFKKGGRVSFKSGGIDKGKRAFLKLLAALGIGTAGAKSGVSLFSKAVGKKAVVKTGVDVATGTPGMPDWFVPLVNKIIKEGDDVTGKLATKERELVYTKKLPDGEEATVYRDLDTGDIRVDYDSVHNMGEGTAPVSLEYKAPAVIDEGKHAGKKTKSEFSAQEVEPVGYTRGPDDYSIEWDGSNVVGNVDDLFSDTSRIKNYAKGKKPTIKEIVTRKRKTDEVSAIHKNESDYIATRQGEGEWDDYLPDIDDID